jgi:hypothetical protein
MSYRLDPGHFDAWLAAYKAAWEQSDPARAAALFTADAAYRETPFEAPLQGRAAIAAYWAKAVSGQRGIAFSSEVLACTGAEGLAHWHCAFTGVPGGEAIDLDGIFRCTFAEQGQASRFEEWWHVRVAAQGETI